MDNYNQNYNVYGNQGINQMNNQINNIDYNRPTPKKGWSWGAFMYNWIWGIANHTYWPLLVFVPILSIIWPFICGAFGHSWALNSGKFRTVEEFNAVQDSWDRAGFVVFIISLIFVLMWLVLIFGILGLSFAELAAEI